MDTNWNKFINININKFILHILNDNIYSFNKEIAKNIFVNFFKFIIGEKECNIIEKINKFIDDTEIQTINYLSSNSIKLISEKIKKQIKKINEPLIKERLIHRVYIFK